MKIELTPDAEMWVKAELAKGRFATAEDAIRYAVSQTKIVELRDILDASEAEGGTHSAEAARLFAREQLDRKRSSQQDA
jgi:Arc/MetJ-type ribon-helix-helix transcriptional regulator